MDIIIILFLSIIVDSDTMFISFLHFVFFDSAMFSLSFVDVPH